MMCTKINHNQTTKQKTISWTKVTYNTDNNNNNNHIRTIKIAIVFIFNNDFVSFPRVFFSSSRNNKIKAVVLEGNISSTFSDARIPEGFISKR